MLMRARLNRSLLVASSLGRKMDGEEGVGNREWGGGGSYRPTDATFCVKTSVDFCSRSLFKPFIAACFLLLYCPFGVLVEFAAPPPLSEWDGVGAPRPGPLPDCEEVELVGESPEGCALLSRLGVAP